MPDTTEERIAEWAALAEAPYTVHGSWKLGLAVPALIAERQRLLDAFAAVRERVRQLGVLGARGNPVTDTLHSLDRGTLDAVLFEIDAALAPASPQGMEQKPLLCGKCGEPYVSIPRMGIGHICATASEETT